MEDKPEIIKLINVVVIAVRITGQILVVVVIAVRITVGDQVLVVVVIAVRITSCS